MPKKSPRKRLHGYLALLVIGVALTELGLFSPSLQLISAVGLGIGTLTLLALVKLRAEMSAPSWKWIIALVIFGRLLAAPALSVLAQQSLGTAGAPDAIRESVVAPAVEELLKPIGLLLALSIWGRRMKPTRGTLALIFACGLAAGAIFGFFESAEKALDPANSALSPWEIMRIRFQGPFQLHVLWTAMVALGLCYRWRYGGRLGSAMFLALYSSAAAFHSIWNSSVGNQPNALALVAGAVMLAAVLWAIVEALGKRR